MKTCPRCGAEESAIVTFSPTATYCKPCAAHISRESYHRRKDRSQEASRNRWRLAHQEPETLARLMFNNAKQRAKKRGIPFSITKAWIRQRLDQHCEVTGLPFTFEVGSPYVPSLDKIDPNGGYTPENTQVVVWIYNAAKHQFTHDDVLKLAQALAA